MDADTMLVAGLLIAGFAIPSMLSSLSDRRTPRIAMVMLLLGGGLVLMAVTTKPGGYTLRQVPDAFYVVIARLMS